MPQDQNRTAHIGPDAPAIVKRAVEIEGGSVGEFALAANDRANRIIEQPSVIRLSIDDQSAFVRAILDPREPTPALRRAFDRHRALIRESR